MEKSKRRKDERVSEETRVSKQDQREKLAGCLVTEEMSAAPATACALATPESEPRGLSPVGSAGRGATGGLARVPRALGAREAFRLPVTSRDASMVTWRGAELRSLAAPLFDAPLVGSGRLRLCLGRPSGPRTMSPGGAGCSNGLLLTVGWLLLAGLRSACGTNVTAVQDPSLAPEGEGEGENEGEEEAENEAEAESEAQTLPEEDGEGGRLLNVDQPKAKPCFLSEDNENYYPC